MSTPKRWALFLLAALTFATLVYAAAPIVEISDCNGMTCVDVTCDDGLTGEATVAPWTSSGDILDMANDYCDNAPRVY